MERSETSTSIPQSGGADRDRRPTMLAPSAVAALTELARLAEQLTVLRSQRAATGPSADCSKSELRLLLAITQRANRRPNELAAHLQVRRSHVNGLLSSLQDRGLVRCDRDPADRRARVVRLTRNGRAYLHELGEASLRRFAADLDDLTEEEMAALKKGLRAAIASVQGRLISSDA